jgi:hypothetical protein
MKPITFQDLQIVGQFCRPFSPVQTEENQYHYKPVKNFDLWDDRIDLPIPLMNSNESRTRDQISEQKQADRISFISLNFLSFEESDFFTGVNEWISKKKMRWFIGDRDLSVRDLKDMIVIDYASLNWSASQCGKNLNGSLSTQMCCFETIGTENSKVHIEMGGGGIWKQVRRTVLFLCALW